MCWWKFFEAAFQRLVREILVDLQEESNNKRDERLDPEATGGGFVFFRWNILSKRDLWKGE